MSTLFGNLKLLAIDYDANLLNAISCLCNRLHYRITTCCTTSEAWEHLKNHNYDIILIETHMPNQEDTYAFVQHVTSLLRIPVIMMSLDDQPSSVFKSISNGACGYWSKPLEENMFKTMWQHVVRKGFSERSDEHVVRKGLSEISDERHDELEVTVKALKKRVRREEEDADVSKQPRAKKSRLTWTPHLHQIFLSAVNSIGINNAVPKKVLKIMDCPDLKLGHVASHLQKYRKYLQGGIKKSKFDGFDFHAEQNNEVQDQDQDIFFEWADFFPDLEDQDKTLPQQDGTQIEESDIFCDLPELFHVDDLLTM